LKGVALRLGNFVPQNHAALSHSFFFKPRALPEVADRGDLGLAIGDWRLMRVVGATGF
jgi:hypothetical protein